MVVGWSSFVQNLFFCNGNNMPAACVCDQTIVWSGGAAAVTGNIMAMRMYKFSFLQKDSEGNTINSISFNIERSHPLSHEEEIYIFKQLAEQNEIDNAIFTTHKTQSIGDPFSS